MRIRLRRPGKHPARWLLAWCLLIALPLCGLSWTLAQLLGPAHFHAIETVAAAVAADPMQGWQDFRRVDHLGDPAFRERARADAHAQPDAHAHADPTRHHHRHDVETTSVVPIGADDHDANAGEGAAPAGVTLAFVLEAACLPHPALHESLCAGWPADRAGPIQSCDTRRLERPPRA